MDQPTRREKILYIEYQSVCPFVRTGSPQPLLRKRVCHPPWTHRWDNSNTPFRERGWGYPVWTTWTESLALCMLCGANHTILGRSVRGTFTGYKNCYPGQRHCTGLYTFSHLFVLNVFSIGQWSSCRSLIVPRFAQGYLGGPLPPYRLSFSNNLEY